MPDLKISDGLYLLHQTVSTSTPAITVDIPTDHVVVIDVSGSMYNELPKIRQQLKNKLPMMVREADSVSIIWFSGRSQFGVVVEAVAMRTAVDLSGVHRAIDNFLKPVGMTGFVEPLQEIERLIGRVQKPGRAINLFFMSDGHDNQWTQDQILSTVEKLQPLVSSAAVVEYGYYANKPLMVKMAERFGASEVLAENFLQYEPIFESAMTKKIAGIKKVEIRLSTPALHGFAFSVGEDEIVTYGVDGRSVMVPEGLRDLYYFSEVPLSVKFVSFTSVHEARKTKHTRGTDYPGMQALYAGLVPLTQRMLSTDIFRVLKATGDVRLIRTFANCFGKQAYTDFQSAATSCVFDKKLRLTDGYNPDEVPAEDAYTILDLLDQLAGDDGNKFYPNHPAFHYERIGRKAFEASGMLTEDQQKRVTEIAMQLHLTTSPKVIQSLQKELAGLVPEKKTVEFEPLDEDAGYPVSSLVLNEDRPNISAQVKIPGEVYLGAVSPDPRLPAFFPTHIFRNYTIIRDGIRNVSVLPVSLTLPTYHELVGQGVVEGDWKADRVFEIDLTKLPLINRKMVKAVSAKMLFQHQYDLLVAKAAQKVFNHYYNENFPSEATKGLVEQYGPDTAEWLASHGVKDYGYSPKVELAEATESYYGKELTVALAGLSSLPTVKSVIDKIDGKKKLTLREGLMSKAVSHAKSYGTHQEYLNERKHGITKLCRKLMREIAQIKFAIIVGQTWFAEFSSLDENSLTMNFDGNDVVCTANLNEIEIKV